MSEQLNENAAPATPGNDEIQWGDAAPAATETPAPEAPPVEAAPAAEAAPAEAAAPVETPAPATEPPKDYEVVTLQNGEREVRLASGAVYRAKSDGELIDQLAKAQFNAARRITELGRQAPPQQAAPMTPPPAPQQASPATMDPATIAILDMLAPGLGLKDGQELVSTWQGMNQKVQSYEQQASQLQQQQVASEFMREAGDFVVTPGNIDRFSNAFESTGLPFNVQNARLVHDALKARGEYEQVQPQQIANAAPATPRTPTGQFAPRMPLPPAPGTAAPAAPTPPDVWAMSDSDFTKFYTEQRR